MNRTDKATAVSEVKSLFTQANGTFLINYQGLTVGDLKTLRNELRKEGAVFKVTKARLMKIAVADQELGADFGSTFKNQVGLVFALQEVPSVAKTIVTFAKTNAKLSVVSGVFESRFMAKQDVEFLASIPSRDVLLAQVAGGLQAIIAGLARSLNQVVEKNGTPTEAAPAAEEAASNNPVTE